MNCQQYREECEKLLDESLSLKQRSEIEANLSAHLKICPECASEFALVQNLRLTLPKVRETAVEPPTFLRANIRAALVEEVQAKNKKKSFFATPFWARPLWAGSVAVALGLLLVSPQLTQFSTTPSLNNTVTEQVGNSTSRSTKNDNSLSQSDAALKPSSDSKVSKSKQDTALNNGIAVLPERTPVPRQKVFAPPPPNLGHSQPLTLPEIRVKLPTIQPSFDKTEKSATPNVKQNQEAQSFQAAPPASKTPSVSQPKSVAPAPSSPPKVQQKANPSQSAPAPSKRTAPVNEKLFSARKAGADVIPEAAPPTAAGLMAPENVAASDWRNGKITLVLSHVPSRQGLFAKRGNDSPSAQSRAMAPMRARNEGVPSSPITKNQETTESDMAPLREPKINRGGGDTQNRVKSSPPMYTTPQGSVANEKQPLLIECKLTLQSEFAVPNARLLQNENIVWQGDLPANKPVEVKWLAPTGAPEKNSFVLEQIGPNNESYRKSLDLGD